MSWNYRVVHQTCGAEEVYAIYEAYYEDNKVGMISAEPDYPVGESMEELRAAIKRYLAALEKPVLEYVDIVTEVDNG